MSSKSRRAAAVAAFVFVVGALVGCASGGTGSDREPPTISARGIGRVAGVPDTIVITLGVESESAQASEALARNNERTKAVIDLLKQTGVAEEDIQTSQFSINPRFDNEGRAIVGYFVTNLLTARVSDDVDAGALIDKAAQAAANDIRVQSIHFEIDDKGSLYEDARREAVEEANKQAEQLAEAAGVELGSVRSITESLAVQPPVPLLARTGGEGAPSVPLEQGSQEITLEVQVVYEISG
ncbi:MAG: SIMPL domain-containing protein [Actinomycetota bacterium]